MPTGDFILELQNVEVSYKKKNILRSADCRVKKGDFIAVTGKSGSGKSTLLYVLGGFLRPVSGFYLFENKKVYRGVGEIGLGTFRKKNVGFLFQDFRLLPFLTIEQNILFPLYFTGDTVSSERTNSLLNLLGLEHRRKAFPKDISGGEAQRTALARALLLEPKLLLLDEPTGNLDSETELEVIEQLLDLKHRGFTIICVTHSPIISKQADYEWNIFNANINVSKNTNKTRSKARSKKAGSGAPAGRALTKPFENKRKKVKIK
jgi:putative ABC transport system ATP-binding protein